MKRWLVGAAGLEAATAGALTEVAPTMVLCDAVSTAVISAEAVVKEDLVAEDPATLQAVGDLTTEASSIPTGLRATTTPTAPTAASRSAAFLEIE